MRDEELCELDGRTGEGEAMSGWKQQHSILCIRHDTLGRWRNSFVLPSHSRCCSGQEGVYRARVVVDITSCGRSPLTSAEG